MYQVFLGYKISNANKDIPAILMDFQKSDDFNLYTYFHSPMIQFYLKPPILHLIVIRQMK